MCTATLLVYVPCEVAQLTFICWKSKNTLVFKIIVNFYLTEPSFFFIAGCVEVVGCVKCEELVCWEAVPESVGPHFLIFIALCFLELHLLCMVFIPLFLFLITGEAGRTNRLLLALWKPTSTLPSLKNINYRLTEVPFLIIDSTHWWI